MKRQPASGLLAISITLASLLLAVVPGMCATQIVSQLPTASAVATVGGGSSYNPIVTPDGRYVLFTSASDNLVAGPGGLPMPDALLGPLNVFVRDRQTGATVLVSVNAAGTAGGNGNSLPSAISANGQFAVFESAASDLIAGDTNAASDVFVRDIVNNTTTLVSVSTNGTVGNGASLDAAITPDGRYVAFVSAANNLVAGDANGIPDVFVRDLQLGVTTLASLGAQKFAGTTGTPLTAGSASAAPALSVDGRYVAFYSTAVGLVANVTSAGELYVRDLVGGTMTWVSTNAHHINASAVSANYALSTNGQLIAYQTTGGNPAGLVFRYNVATGAHDSIATNGAMVTTLDREAGAIDMSADGRFVAFTLANTSGGASIELWDAQSGATSLISGTNKAALCEFPRVDQTGRYIAFTSDDPLLTTNSDGKFHIYRSDTSTNAIQLVDVGTNGATPISYVTTPFRFSAEGGALAFDCMDGALSMNPYKFDVFLRDFSSDTTEVISAPAPALPCVTPLNSSGLTGASVNSNGQYVAFVSSADGLVGIDTNGFQDVFVHGLASGANTLVSMSVDGPYSGNGNSSEPAISASGRYVAFSSYATNLVLNDTNNACDVFVRDLQTGTTALVSTDTSGTGDGNGNSTTPQISADGQRVLFFSLANNLTTNSVNASLGPNLFWRDMQAGVTYAITTTGGASAPLVVGTMTPDGSNVLFGVPGVGEAKSYLYLWNAQTHLTVTVASNTYIATDVSISADALRGAFVAASTLPGYYDTYALDLVTHSNVLLAPMVATSHTHAQFSGDGQFLAYPAQANLKTNGIDLYDFETATSTMITQSYDSTNGVNATCDSPAVNAAGRFVAYRSAATNLVPGDTSGYNQIFLYDRLTGGTTLISASMFGPSAAGGPSLNPVFSGDGQTLFFESWASDLTPGDFNESSDVFALALPSSGAGGLTNSGPPLTFTGIAWPTGGAPFSTNQPLMLSWTAAPGAGYQVQFKNNLTDTEWQTLASSVTIVGSQGQVMDNSPGPTSRYYRIISF